MIFLAFSLHNIPHVFVQFDASQASTLARPYLFPYQQRLYLYRTPSRKEIMTEINTR